MIVFNDELKFKLYPGKSQLELAIDKKIDLNHSCGGYGTCGTCRVIVDNHVDLPARNEIELEMANDRGFSPNERLACQTICDRPLNVKVDSHD